MNILSHIVPQVLYRTSSPYNAHIEVRELDDKRYLVVDGVLQTGPDIQDMYEHAFKAFQMPSYAHTILLLGVGGGGVITLLRHYYPDSLVDAVDIDKKMIYVAKKYFHLSVIPKVTFIEAEAEEYIRKVKKKYDLIVIDLYIGDHFPHFQTSADFYTVIHKKLQPGGSVVMNFQGTEEYQSSRDTINTFLPTIFSNVERIPIRRNMLYFLQK